MRPSEEEPKTDDSKSCHDLEGKIVHNAHAEDMVDHYWGTINYIFGLIQASEIKAGLLLSFYGILLNFMYQKMEEIFATFPNNIPLYILLGLWFACTVVSIYFCIRCFIPRIEAKYDKNIFFFGDVITKYGGIKEFSKTFYKISMDENQLFDQMGQQIFIISKITALKFKNVNKALRFLAWSILVLLFIIVYYSVLMLF
jgi:hypothetical protein